MASLPKVSSLKSKVMEAVVGAPVPNPNPWFAMIGGTMSWVMFSSPGSMSSVIVSAAVGAAVSYLTGYLLKRLFERKGQ